MREIGIKTHPKGWATKIKAFLFAVLFVCLGATLCLADDDSVDEDKGNPDDLQFCLSFEKSDSLDIAEFSIGIIDYLDSSWTFALDISYLKLARLNGYSRKFRVTGDWIIMAGAAGVAGLDYLVTKVLFDSSKTARYMMAPIVYPVLATVFHPTLSYSLTSLIRANVGYDTEYHLFSYEDGVTIRPRLGFEIGKPQGFILNMSADYGMFWSFEKSSRDFGPGVTVQIRLGGDTYAK